jgi:hypothetical protein
MAETERDEKVSAGYRALGGEEPPRALDEAILAASRRSPTRWRLPLSVAALLVLAVGVTLRLLPQRPDAESVALAPQVSSQSPRLALRPQGRAGCARRSGRSLAKPLRHGIRLRRMPRAPHRRPHRHSRRRAPPRRAG